MNIKNMTIGTRLGASFGMVLIMMAALIAVGMVRLAGIGDINAKIIGNDWTKAEAANTIDTVTRANARRTMELLIATDSAQTAKIYEHITANKKAISDAIATLDKLIDLPEGKALLAQIRERRGAYVKSFTKVGKLLEQGQKDEAVITMNTETLPALDALQEPVIALAAWQKKIVVASGAEARQSIESARILLLGLGAVALLLSIGFAVWITRSITGPILRAVKVAQTVAAGDLSSHIEVGSKDETGQLLQALGDMNTSLQNIVSQVRIGTDTIATASSQIASGNLDLSSRTEQQAGSLQETASSMEELTSTVKQNADNARQANGLALSASEVALKGGQVVSQVVETMGSINESARKIVDIIGVIDGIAFQTNILALNAAVEAARAGEQGRGFAVVASEVRNLAQRSAAAAKEIKILIDNSVEQVDIGAKLVDQAGTTMDEIVASVKRVTDIMGEISAASREQTTGIEQVNQTISAMDSATQQNAALVEQAAAAAESLQDQAGNLAQVVSVFRLDGRHAGAAAPRVMQLTAKRSRLPAAPKSTRDPSQFTRIANAKPGSNQEWEAF